MLEAALQHPGLAGGRANEWALEQIRPETSLEAETTETELSYSPCTLRRQGSFKKTTMP